ncbi:MAG: hypothetical protein E7559_08370 [Ruminococcaceae bacterium]|nr:hypothetical protein [Oscillospiraceae bacterium]
MAERRMICRSVIETDQFQEMSMEARLLYYELLVRADDDGFVGQPRSVARMIGAGGRELTILESSGYVIIFASGVCVITHWRINNQIRHDRYHPTTYLEEKSLLRLLPNREYVLAEDGIACGSLLWDNDMEEICCESDEPECFENGFESAENDPCEDVVANLATEYSLVKSSQVKSSKVKSSQDQTDDCAQSAAEGVCCQQEQKSCESQKAAAERIKAANERKAQERRFEEFWEAYPRHVGRKKAEEAYRRLKPSEQLHRQILLAVYAASQSEQWQREGGRYIPHGATYINGRRWEDECQPVLKKDSDTDWGISEECMLQ